MNTEQNSHLLSHHAMSYGGECGRNISMLGNELCVSFSIIAWLPGAALLRFQFFLTSPAVASLFLSSSSSSRSLK